MSRRGPKQAKASPVTATATATAPAAVLLGPWGLAGLLLVATVVLGVLYALKDDATTEIVQEITGCDPNNDPINCKARFPIHEHANFALFIRGVKFDFNQPQFLSTATDEIGSQAHIHPPRYGVAHTHLSNTTWDELFRILGFELSDPSLVAGTTDAQTCLKLPSGERLCGSGNEKLRFMVNGVRINGVANLVISDLDRVLITYGSETDEQLLALAVQVGDDACIPSQSCPERIPADEPKELCSGRGECAK